MSLRTVSPPLTHTEATVNGQIPGPRSLRHHHVLPLGASRYSNYDLELQTTSPYGLHLLLHCGTKAIPFHLKHNLLFWDTAVAWREIGKKCKFIPLCPTISPFVVTLCSHRISNIPHSPHGLPRVYTDLPNDLARPPPSTKILLGSNYQPITFYTFTKQQALWPACVPLEMYASKHGYWTCYWSGTFTKPLTFTSL